MGGAPTVVSPDVVAAGLAGAALAGLAAAAVAWRTRRRVARRAATLASRLGSTGSAGAAGGTMEAALASLERAVSTSAGQATATSRALDRLAETLGVVEDGVVVCDEHGVVVFRNRAASELLEDRMGGALAREAVTRVMSSAPGGGIHREDLELFGPPHRTLVITAARLGAPDRPLGAAAVVTDVSERRRLEEVRRDFVANISHELKTPVGALALLAETIASEDDPAATSRLVSRLQVEAFRVGRIIEDLLDLSRIEADASPLREQVPLGLVVVQATDRVRPLADHRGIQIVLTDGPDAPSVMGDRRQLVSAVHSLVENAVTYSDDGGEVRVGVSGRGRWVELTVADHGVGIPARDLERIFERFYRVDRARGRETGGTGLGLAIVRHVAGNHGGDVSVVSEEGEGSTFTLRLPASGPSGTGPAEHPGP